MRLRKKWWARPELEDTNFVITNKNEYKGKWHEEFQNENPIYLELGCGKGRFIARSAVKNRNVNYIGIDFKDEVLVRAKRTVEDEFDRNNISRDEIHVRLIPMDIAFIEEAFSCNEIDRIHLNFSTPWPKERHKKRRLSHPRFLNKYKTFLKKGGEVWMKTDNEELFEDSIEYFSGNGFTIDYITHDLHNSDFKDNIVTEYEEKFSNMDMKIMCLTARYTEE